MDPANLQPLARFELGPCTVLDCDGNADALLPAGSGMALAVNLALPLQQGPVMDSPLVVHAAVLDQAGTTVAKGDAVFMSNGIGAPAEVPLVLDFLVSPSFGWGQSGASAGEARPAYSLVLAAEVGSQMNAQLLQDLGLRMRTQVGAKPIP